MTATEIAIKYLEIKIKQAVAVENYEQAHEYKKALNKLLK